MHRLHAATNTQRQTYIFNKLMDKRPYLILECIQIVHTDNMCKMKTID